MFILSVDLSCCRLGRFVSNENIWELVSWLNYVHIHFYSAVFYSVSLLCDKSFYIQVFCIS